MAEAARVRQSFFMKDKKNNRCLDRLKSFVSKTVKAEVEVKEAAESRPTSRVDNPYMKILKKDMKINLKNVRYEDKEAPKRVM